MANIVQSTNVQYAATLRQIARVNFDFSSQTPHMAGDMKKICVEHRKKMMVNLLTGDVKFALWSHKAAEMEICHC